MENPTFDWKPDVNQTYSEDTDTTLEGEPKQFNKLSGKTFIMQAPSRTLTLNITETADQEAQSTIWGAGGTYDPTAMKFYGGTFIYDANSMKSALLLTSTDPSAPGTQLTFYQDGKFMVQNGFMVMTESPLKIELHHRSVFDIATNGLAMGGVISVKIFEEAALAMKAKQAFSLVHAYLEVATTSSAPDRALTLTCDGPEGLLLDDVQVEFAQQAKGLLRAPLLDCDRISQIRADRNAQVDLQFDDVKMKGGSTFILSYGESQITFGGYSEGKTPFDFMNKNYPKGLFNFITESGPNNCQFRFTGDSLSAFDASALIKKGFVAVNGEPQYDREKIDVNFEQGLITVKLK